jgi:hypothetical protein
VWRAIVVKKSVRNALAAGMLALTAVALVAWRFRPRRAANNATSSPEAVVELMAVTETSPQAIARRNEGATIPSPAEKAKGRDDTAEQVRSSGPDRRGLVGAAQAVSAGWLELAREIEADVRFGAWECYAAGCIVEGIHGDPKSARQLEIEIPHSQTFLEWNGGKMRGSPVARPNGEIAIQWILFSPPDDEPAMTPRRLQKNELVTQESNKLRPRDEPSNEEANP